MATTKTYTKNGFDLKAVIHGKAENRTADIYTDSEYCGKLYITHVWGGDRYAYWTDEEFKTSSDSLFEAAKTLSGKYIRGSTFIKILFLPMIELNLHLVLN